MASSHPQDICIFLFLLLCFSLVYHYPVIKAMFVFDDAGDGHNSIVLISVQIPFLHKKSVLLLIHTWKRLPRKYYDTTPYRVTHCGLTQNMVQRAIFQAKMRECCSISRHPKYNGRNPAELDLPAARGRNLHDGWIVRAGGS